MPASPRVNHFLICEKPDLLDADEIAASLRAAGHRAEVTQNVPPFNFELAVDPNRSRVMVRFGGDLHGDCHVVTSDLEILDDLVADGVIPESERAKTRRFVFVGHWDHADKGAADALVALLCQRLFGRVHPVTGSEDDG